MILHGTILFPLITWACIFFLFSNALGMLLPLWDSNEYIAISKRHWMQWRLQCFFFFQVVSKHLPLPNILFCESTRREEESQNQNVNGTNWALLHQMELFSMIFSGLWVLWGRDCFFACLHCSLQHCRLESLHSNPECLKPSFLPACCLSKPGTTLASICVILEHKFMQWEGRRVGNPRYSDI